MLDRSIPIIRHARREELPEIADLTAAALEVFRGKVSDKVLGLDIEYSSDVAGRWHNGDVLVVESDGRIAGTVTYADHRRNVDDTWPAGWATIRTLAVHPNARGRRLGRLLVVHCIEAARASGATTLGLHTATFMTAACHIYREAGFSCCPEHDFFASGLFGFDPAEADVLVTAYRLDL
jgi:GNAT superfamily N-acetyltransferase